MEEALPHHELPFGVLGLLVNSRALLSHVTGVVIPKGHASAQVDVPLTVFRGKRPGRFALAGMLQLALFLICDEVQLPVGCRHGYLVEDVFCEVCPRS